MQVEAGRGGVPGFAVVKGPGLGQYFLVRLLFLLNKSQKKRHDEKKIIKARLQKIIIITSFIKY